jgi:hypothetical protein
MVEWRIAACGCCNGLEWGGEYPRECRHCWGNGRVFVTPGGRAAIWPGGPFVGSGWQDEYACGETIVKDS